MSENELNEQALFDQRQQVERQRDEALTHAQLLREHVGTLEEQVAELNAELARAAEEALKLQRQRDRLAVDALAHLAGAGIATPEEGYVKAPHCLSDNIDRLAAERDHLKLKLDTLTAAVSAAVRMPGVTVVICREGGGPEDIGATLALTIGRLVNERDAAKGKLQ